MAPEPTLHLQLSGHPSARAAGSEPVALAPHDATLLAWLALEGATSRQRLATLLWPDSDEAAARNLLRQRLFQLRRRLGVDPVQGSGIEPLVLAPGVTHDLDAVDGLQGVLGDIESVAGGELAVWLAGQRQRSVERRRSRLALQADEAEQAQRLDEACRLAEELIALDRLSETAHRRLMRLHYLAGDRAAALRSFDRCEQWLKDELGARPGAETLALLATVEGSGAAGAVAPTAVLPASVLRPPRLIGRTRELVSIQAGWQAAQVVVLVGEAGMGKSRLLQEFAAGQGGIAAAAGRPGDAGVPFATLARLMRAVLALDESPAASAVPALARQEIARVLPEFDREGTRPPGEGQRLQLQRGLAALLASRVSLVGLIVDDLHFADEASIDLLRGLIDETGADGPRWLLAHRPAESGSPVQALQDALAEQARLCVVAIAPLDEAQLAALVDTLALPGVDGATLAPGLHRRTGGNPLFVLETLKQAWVDRRLAHLAQDGALPRTPSVERLIERRLARLSPAALALARVAAIAGVDFDVALAEAVLGTSVMLLADALNELESAQVLRDTQFAHDLVYETVRASVPGAVARHTHAGVAQWLEQHEGEPARIAGHWLEARRDAAARPWLQRAAERALQGGRSREAMAFLERAAAIEYEHDPDAAFGLLLRLVDLQHDARLAADEATTSQKLLAWARRPTQEVQAHLRAGWSHFIGDRLEPARAHAEKALELALTLHEDLSAGRAHELLGLIDSAAERFGEAIAHLRAALPAIDATGTPKRRLECHGHLGLLLDQQGRIAEAAPAHREALHAARELGDTLTLATALRNASINRVHAGDLRGAASLLEQSLRCTEADPSVGGEAFSHALLIPVRADLGDFGTALDHAERALEAFKEQDLGWYGPVRTMRAGLWLHLAQWTRALQELDAPLHDRVPAHSRARRQLLRARALAPLGRPVMALLDEALELAPTTGRDDARMLVQLERLRHLPTADALRTGEALAGHARERGMVGFEMWAQLRMAEALLREPAAVDMRLSALIERVAALQATTWCYSTSPAEAWWVLSRAARRLGADARARSWHESGRRWVIERAERSVPAEFRDSFLHRHPVHVALLGEL